MKSSPSSITILLADDDPDDRLLMLDAFEESRLLNMLETVEDGERLLDYLHRRNGFETAARPQLILLDVNMPRKSGFETLREIKSDENLRRIPVVMMSTSQSDGDIRRAYDYGANSFVVKPVTFESLIGLVKAIGSYWFQTVELPPD